MAKNEWIVSCALNHLISPEISWSLRYIYLPLAFRSLKIQISTLKYIAENTSLRVPKVLTWNSDCLNETSAEFMILEKVPIV
jgi:hypothetical protein